MILGFSFAFFPSLARIRGPVRPQTQLSSSQGTTANIPMMQRCLGAGSLTSSTASSSSLRCAASRGRSCPAHPCVRRGKPSLQCHNPHPPSRSQASLRRVLGPKLGVRNWHFGFGAGTSVAGELSPQSAWESGPRCDAEVAGAARPNLEGHSSRAVG